MMDSSTTLGRHVRSHLKAEDLAYCDEFWGFPDCMISRVVPRPEPDPLVILTEDYNEWTTRREHFKGDKPKALAALEPVDNQTARLERKLLIHNGGHAICGYTAFHRGHEFVHEALQDPVVVEHVLRALHQIGEVVRQKHGFSVESIDAYKADLSRRGAIAELRDPILRVVRDPIRKLSARERLVAPAMLAAEFDLPREWIVKGIVAAMKYHHPGDPQSEQLAEMLGKNGVRNVIENVCSIDEQSLLSDEIIDAWDRWNIDVK
jgi:mannitol-1-phosphate 5-dehydrogenase